MLNYGLGAHPNESSQPSRVGTAGGTARRFISRFRLSSQPVGMRGPRLGQWRTLGWCGLGWEPRRACGVRPRPPRRRTLQPAGVPKTDSGAAAATAARSAAASAAASAAQASNFRPPRTRAGRRARAPEGGGRDAAQRPPRRLSRFGARAGRGRQGRDSRASRCLPPQNPP